MADNVYYDMGQIRYKTVAEDGENSYKGNGNFYLTNLNFHSYPVTTKDGQNEYRDILLIPDNPPTGSVDYFEFNNGAAYHLDLDIPTNLSYNMVFDIMLVKAILEEDGTVSIKNPTQYQEVRRITVAKDKRNVKTYSDVILYPSPDVPEEGKTLADSQPVACVVYDRSDANAGEVYYDEDSGEYMIKGDGTPANPDREIKNYNVVSMAHTWLTETSIDYEHFDIVFSKKVSDVSFNAILLKMYRENVTNGITFESTDKNGEVLAEYNGLHVDTEFLEDGSIYEGQGAKIEQQCNEITNLITKETGQTKFNNIGVWSHPDSILAINGEEIRIGQSGYYELNDFEITSFGIVVRTPKDKFSLDYQYQISDTNDETEGGN